MGVGELLDQIRAYYLERFDATVAECAEAAGAPPLTEPEMLDASGALAVEGVLRTPMRMDIVLLRDGRVERSFRVETDGMVKFEPIKFTWEKKVKVSLEPFEWQDCHVSMSPAPTTFDPLVAWFSKWFEPRDPKALGLLGVVHFLSDPKERDGRADIEVDFGSAPVEAFEELLDACGALGASEVTVGSESASR